MEAWLVELCLGVSAVDVPTLFLPPFPRMRHAAAYSARSTCFLRGPCCILDFVYFRLCPKEFAVKAGLGKCIFSSLACSKLDFSQGLERLMRDSLQPADSLPPHGNLKSRQALQTSNQLRIVLSTWSSVALANGGGH